MLPVPGEAVPCSVDLLQRDLIPVAKLKHIDIEFLRRGGWGECGDDFRVEVFVESDRVIECLHQVLELR